MSDDIIGQIDAAVRANLCGCGCGQQIPARGPSPDFVNEKHQQVWSARGYRASGGKIAADWYTRLAPTVIEHDEDCDPAGCPHHYVQARTVSVRFRMFHLDGSDCPTPEDCELCREARARRDETPMGRVVRETSTLRRAIDRILGKSR